MSIQIKTFEFIVEEAVLLNDENLYEFLNNLSKNEEWSKESRNTILDMINSQLRKLGRWPSFFTYVCSL